MTIAALLQDTATKYNKEILLMPFIKVKDELQGAITVRSNIKNEELLASFDADIELRPHTGAYTVQTGTDINGRKIAVFVGDVIVEENAEALRKTFLNDQLDNQEPSKHPLNMMIIGAIAGSVGEKITQNLFLAVRNGAGTTTASLFNGFDTIATTEKTAGKIAANKNNYVNLGNTTAANALDKLKAFYAGWTPHLKKAAGVKVNIDETFKRLINENIQDDQPFGFANLSFSQMVAKIVGWREDVEIITHIGKEGSSWIQACTSKIMVCGTDKEADLDNVQVNKIDNPWKTQFVMKGCWGCEYATLNGKLICFGEITLPS